MRNLKRGYQYFIFLACLTFFAGLTDSNAGKDHETGSTSSQSYPQDSPYQGQNSAPTQNGDQRVEFHQEDDERRVQVPALEQTGQGGASQQLDQSPPPPFEQVMSDEAREQARKEHRKNLRKCGGTSTLCFCAWAPCEVGAWACDGGRCPVATTSIVATCLSGGCFKGCDKCGCDQLDNQDVPCMSTCSNWGDNADYPGDGQRIGCGSMCYYGSATNYMSNRLDENIEGGISCLVCLNKGICRGEGCNAYQNMDEDSQAKCSTMCNNLRWGYCCPCSAAYEGAVNCPEFTKKCVECSCRPCKKCKEEIDALSDMPAPAQQVMPQEAQQQQH